MTAPLRILTPFWKILIGHIVIILPYIIRNSVGILTGFDWTIEDAAASLGANPAKVLWKVTLPIIRPAIISGALLAFLYSFDEVVISSFLTSAKSAPYLYRSSTTWSLSLIPPSPPSPPF
jgi:putative spermidine/putrescine transport system permease protein